MDTPFIREARPGDEAGIHESHMRSIREVCVKDHGEEEVRGWGNRPLGNRWIGAIREGYVWVVEFQHAIHGHGYIKITTDGEAAQAEIRGLYLTPEVLRQGLGFKLATMMIDKAKELGAKSITLDSTLTAHSFYQRLGFVDTGPVEASELGGSMVRGIPMVMTLTR
jgi:putative acetyltransferase